MNIVDKAKIQREYILKAIQNLSNEDAVMIPELFEQLKENGSLVKAGTRINWNGELKCAAVDLWDTAENNPDSAPSLWENISYKEEYRVIPETITVNTAFSIGERGWWNGVLYESLIEPNVYTPDQYSQGWVVVQ